MTLREIPISRLQNWSKQQSSIFRRREGLQTIPTHRRMEYDELGVNETSHGWARNSSPRNPAYPRERCRSRNFPRLQQMGICLRTRRQLGFANQACGISSAILLAL